MRNARVSTAIPPANAKAKGTKPAARRDWESETRSEKCGKRTDESSMPSTSTVPPSTNALQRRRAAKRGERDERQRGDRDRTRPVDERRGEVIARGRGHDEIARVRAEARAPSRPRSGCASGSPRRSARATRRRAAPGRRRRRAQRRPSGDPTRTRARGRARNPTSGIAMKSAYVGCTKARSSPAKASATASPREGVAHEAEEERRSPRERAAAAPPFPGARASGYAPPPPGASAIIPTCASIVATPASRRAEDHAPHLEGEDERERERAGSTRAARPASGRRRRDARRVRASRARAGTHSPGAGRRP